jgi:hypothetical protein
MERHFTRMILIQVLITIVTYVLYAAQYTYSTITADWQKGPFWIATDSVIGQIGRICFFLNHVIGFYIYISISNDIRTTFKKIMLQLRVGDRPNQVVPFQSALATTNTRRRNNTNCCLG